MRYILGIISILVVGFSVFVLEDACKLFAVPEWIAVSSYVAVGIYVATILFILYKAKNSKTAVALCVIGLNAIPAALSIVTLKFTSDYGYIMMIPGTINEYEKAFTDIQRQQIRAAKANGITPYATREEFSRACHGLVEEKTLAEISSNKYYHVGHLTHSLPYLVPEAESLLTDIAELFREYSGTKAKFVITSILRTGEDVNELQKINANATKNSCHCFGTTFDISYVRFKGGVLRSADNTGELREALSKALYELRSESRCYVKFENRQKCYHIAVRR